MAEVKKIDRDALAYIISRIATFAAYFNPDEYDEDDPHVNWAFLPFEENVQKAYEKCRFDYLSDEERDAVENTPEYQKYMYETSEDEEEPEFDEKGRIYGVVCGWTTPGDLDTDDDFGDGYRRLCVRFAYVDSKMPKSSYIDFSAWKNPFFDEEEVRKKWAEEPGEDFDWKAYLDVPEDELIPDTQFAIYSRHSVYGHDTFESEWLNYLRIAEKITELYEKACKS